MVGERAKIKLNKKRSEINTACVIVCVSDKARRRNRMDAEDGSSSTANEIPLFIPFFFLSHLTRSFSHSIFFFSPLFVTYIHIHIYTLQFPSFLFSFILNI